MNKKEIDLIGMICPYPVTHIIYEVDKMRKKEEIKFLVDDPLAIKSTPEELEDYEDIEIQIEKIEKHWEIFVARI